ncbi:MAG: SDR family NAD(P)-dependent oxidoreductase [Bacteroidota bacterium]
MSNKILVTGASKGIGLAIARIFYQHDFEVIICPEDKKDSQLPKMKCQAYIPIPATSPIRRR